MKGQGMTSIEGVLGNTRVTDLVALLKERRLPLIHEKANIEEVVEAMIRFEHSRLLYVVDDEGKLTGTISLGLLVRHVFSPSHEPQIHPRFLISMITAETAKDIMKKNPVVTTEEEEVGIVLKRMIRTNVKEIPVLDSEKRVIADLTIVDLLRFIVVNSREY
ncbi:MAG: CBS domain-containing protein [Proteobacteria bacterium]|nr:CBS domain-containing protein [Pseudomonadota bacterium]MCK4488295.1 CBS domain-containing protein [Desulfobacterales bacterium]